MLKQASLDTDKSVFLLYTLKFKLSNKLFWHFSSKKSSLSIPHKLCYWPFSNGTQKPALYANPCILISYPIPKMKHNLQNMLAVLILVLKRNFTQTCEQCKKKRKKSTTHNQGMNSLIQRIHLDQRHLAILPENKNVRLKLCLYNKSLTHIHPDTHTWVAPIETWIRVREQGHHPPGYTCKSSLSTVIIDCWARISVTNLLHVNYVIRNYNLLTFRVPTFSAA